MNESEMTTEQMITRDIDALDRLIITNSLNGAWDLFLSLEGKYQSCIQNFYRGIKYAYPDETGVDKEDLKDDEQELRECLKLLRGKLVAFHHNLNVKSVDQQVPPNINISPAFTNINNNSISNSIDVTVTVKQIQNDIQNNNSIPDEEKKEAIGKLNEIESILQANENKSSKWQKIKPILIWLANKSVDVGIALLPLIFKTIGT